MGVGGEPLLHLDGDVPEELYDSEDGVPDHGPPDQPAVLPLARTEDAHLESHLIRPRYRLQDGNNMKQITGKKLIGLKIPTYLKCPHIIRSDNRELRYRKGAGACQLDQH